MESDPIGLDGGVNTFGYVEASPLGVYDFYGLAGEEDPEEEFAQPTIAQELAAAQVRALIDQIRQYDPSYEYSIMSAPGYRYNASDVDNLEKVLRQYREPNQNASGVRYECPIEEPASEKTARDMARQIERDLGKDARREFHDAKEPGAGDRSLSQLKEDARQLYQAAGQSVPNWLK